MVTLIGCPEEIMLTGFCVCRRFAEAEVDVGEVVEYEEEFEVPEGDFVLASESVQELNVSQLSS